MHRLVITCPVDNSVPNASEESLDTHKSVGILAVLFFFFIAIDLSSDRYITKVFTWL